MHVQDKESITDLSRLLVPHDILLGLHWAFVGVTPETPVCSDRRLRPRAGDSGATPDQGPVPHRVLDEK